MVERDVFLTMVEEQGFSAAAKRLDTTAAISRRIKNLEQRMVSGCCNAQRERFS
jgi:hypothetical protein